MTSVSSHTTADISLCRFVERLQGFGHKHRLDAVISGAGTYPRDVGEFRENFAKIQRARSGGSCGGDEQEGLFIVLTDEYRDHLLK